MKVSEAITTAWVQAQDELPSFAVGSEDWNRLFNLVVQYIPEWAKEAEWISLYEPEYSIGTVTATNSFDFDADEVLKFSSQEGDYVEITNPGSTNISKYTIVNANKLKYYRDKNVCARVGDSLRFSKTFATTDAEYGGTITAPVILQPATVTNENSTIPVDDANWVVKKLAYHIALLDILRKDIAPLFEQEAIKLMADMKEQNELVQESTVTGMDMSGIGSTYL